MSETTARHGHETPSYLDRPRPVELVSALTGVEVLEDPPVGPGRPAPGAAVLLRCETRRFAPRLQDYYGTVAETVLAEPVPGRPATVRLDFWGDDVVRFRYAPGDTVPETPVPPLPGREGVSPMLVGAPGPVAVRHAVTSDGHEFRTGSIAVRVVADPFRLEVRDGDGRLLWATKPVDIDGLRRPRNQWNPPEQRWIFLHRLAYPLGSTTADMSDGHSGYGGHAFVSFDLRHDEHVVGLGEGFGRVDRVGTTQEMWLEEAFSNASPAGYKKIPLHLSSRDHAVFVHTSNALRYHVGSREHSALSVVVDDTVALDWFVLAGPPRDVLPRYTALTGAPALPPRWSFGFWLGRITYSSQQEVEDVVAEMQRRGFPLDVVHVDTGWFEREYVCDLRFSPQRFPDPAGMTARLREQGVRVCLWQWPNYNVGSRLFDEGLAGGYLARRESGHAYTFAGGYGDDAGLVDFTSPEAVAWYQGNLAALFDLGVAAIKADYGEGAPPSARYRGLPSHAVHNLYPLLYQEAVWEATRAAHGDDAVIWARAGWAGCQRFPVHWSGDGVARFEDLACVLRAALSMGVSGVPFHSHDVGGFSGNPSPELWVRWLQLGIFSSHLRAHGSPPREPWAYGEEAAGISRALLDLRYRLLPYIWTEAAHCAASSEPFLRPMLLDHPGEPGAWDVDDQYLFGRDLLVAPVLEEGVRRRSVWLPPGDWVPFDGGDVLRGPGRVDVAAPLESIPVLVRAGAVVPLGPPMRHVDERPCDPLTVRLYAPTTDGRSTVTAGPGAPVHLDWRTADGQVRLAVAGAPGEVHAEVIGSAGGSGAVAVPAHPADRSELVTISPEDDR
jgi:alpha-D-xyloside xylohydrolase